MSKEMQSTSFSSATVISKTKNIVGKTLRKYTFSPYSY